RISRCVSISRTICSTCATTRSGWFFKSSFEPSSSGLGAEGRTELDSPAMQVIAGESWKTVARFERTSNRIAHILSLPKSSSHTEGGCKKATYGETLLERV